jgi:PTS system nitrogen regulatory IIA component
MNGISDLIAPAAVLARISGVSKRQVLQTLAENLAEAAGCDGRAAFEAVLLRERLSGTGIGEGVALPHARVPGLKRAVVGFARLDPPCDFDGLDGRPADLVLMLLAPAEDGADHLKALARISRFLRRPEIRERLRAARGPEELLAVFSAHAASDAA